MELLSHNDIRSLSHRVPPQSAFVDFVQAVATQAVSWARRTHQAVQPFDPNWGQLQDQWQQMRADHGEHKAAYELARYIESRIVSPGALAVCGPTRILKKRPKRFVGIPQRILRMVRSFLAVRAQARCVPGLIALSVGLLAGFGAVSLSSPAHAQDVTYEFRKSARSLHVVAPGAEFEAVQALPTSFAYEATEVGDDAQAVLTLSFMNRGPSSGSLTATLQGEHAADFSLTNACDEVPVAQTCEMSVRFRPLSTGLRLAQLQVLGAQVVLDATGTPARAVVSASTTWNPAARTSGITLSSGNLRAQVTGSWSTVVDTAGLKRGKRYWEIRNDTGNSDWNIFVGLVTEQSVLIQNSLIGSSILGTSAVPYNTAKYNSLPGVTLTSLSNPSREKTGSDVIMVAYDGANGALYVGVNGVWAYGGSPTSGALRSGAVATGFSGYLLPAISMFGGSTNPARTSVVNFGATPFVYPVPFGYNQ